MEKSRLVLAFNSLSSSDLKQFSTFVHSPFFNKNQQLAALCNFLVEWKKSPGKPLNKEIIHQVILPGNAYQDQKVRLAMSGLLKLLEQFLVYQSLTEDETAQRIKLAACYRKLNLNKHFQRALRDAKQTLEKQGFRNADFYNYSYQLKWEEYLYMSANHRSQSLNLQAISDNIDQAFLSLKLRQSCFAIAHQAVYKAEYNLGLLPEVLRYIEAHNLLEIPAISLYYYCYFALTQPQEEQYFQTLKAQIFSYGHHFPATEIRDLYLLAINYCIKRLNEGNTSYFREGLDLYKKGLDRSILLQNGQLSRFTYNNIVAMGLRTKEYDWTAHFIHRYKDFLKKDYRENTFAFNLARLEYERKNYGKALRHLQYAEYKDLLNNLIAKTLMLKIYFELGETKLLQSHLDAMKIFIRRKRVIGYHKKNYLNIVYYTQKILNVNPYDKAAIKALQEQLETEEVLTDRKWLLDQLNNEHGISNKEYIE